MNWLLIPGWSTSPTIFSPYLKIFNNPIMYNWAFKKNETESLDSVILEQVNKNYSILCYSLGCLKALELSQKLKPNKIISIGGFTSFCDNDKKRKAHVNLISEACLSLQLLPQTSRQTSPHNC